MQHAPAPPQHESLTEVFGWMWLLPLLVVQAVISRSGCQIWCQLARDMIEAEAGQSLIRAGGVRGKFELAENPCFFGNFGSRLDWDSAPWRSVRSELMR
jgi:hypothetical protein